ncbi:MAG: M3 family metallopeptidase, partial [Bdellovibrionales bacterium]|nr:M3 family metallopeptidase [Bdellovibrionales bacterium]NQZ19364.1 M3 family metallopeptidase [Bdellovibrionales bacterium]
MAHKLIALLDSPNTPEQSFPFNEINSQDFEAAIDEAITMAKENVKTIEEQNNPDFKNTIEALELSSSALDKLTTIFYNLYHACADENIEKAAGAISEKLADYSNDVQLSEKLFAQVKDVYEQKLNLKPEEAKLLEETYKGFTRNGALLNETDKETLRNIDRELASINPVYSNNLLKATNAFKLNITDEKELEGLPDTAIATAKQEAEKNEQEGWTFTLQAPSYLPFMKYMKNRSLRQEMWMAYNSKALEGEFSNRELCQKIATLRNQRAQLLGFDTHAHFVLEKRMAKTPERVFTFLEELIQPSFKAAQKELEDLKAYAKEHHKADFDIMPWDFSFFSEKFKKHLFDISEQELRPYFPLEAVKKGIFIHGEKLYGLKFSKQTDIPAYHEDVEVYRVERGSDFIGLLYVDFFPRDNKRSGAWMTNYREQGFDGESVKRPHVSIVCNFSKPTTDKPSLLTFYEVQTLFHEFGHALHSLLSDCHYTSLSGTNVLWDFVELPSQVMENWTYEKESLDLFAKHYETGEAIPAELVKKLKDSSNFQAGYASTRQVSFALVDMNWHSDIKNKNLDPVVVENEATKDIQLLPKVEGTNFSVGFSHIFAGGYSAGYYSYKWAEVLDADAFELFQEKGIFDAETAKSFYDQV